MKKQFFLAALLFLSAGIFAQSTSRSVSQSEKITIVRSNDDCDEKITIVNRIFHNVKLVDPLPDLYYSYLNMMTGTFGLEANIPLRSSSFEWGFYSTTPVFCTRDGHFGMATGFGISNAYNFFTHDKVLKVDDNREAYIESLNVYSSIEGHGPANNFAHRSYLRYWSLRLPVMFEFQWRINGTPLALAAGCELEWRFGMRSFARYGGAKHTITDSLNYSPIGFNALFSFVFKDTVIFFRSGLTEMLNVKDCGDIYQMSIGFGFNF